MARRFSLGEIKSPREFAFSRDMEKADKSQLEKLRSKLVKDLKLTWPFGSNFRTDTKEDVRAEEANLVSSKAVDKPGHHYPVIDCDYPIAVVQSRTPGHYHLYIEKAIEHEAYLRILLALYDAGLLGRGNLKQMDYAGCTFARVGPYRTILAESEHDLAEDARATFVDWKDWDFEGGEG